MEALKISLDLGLKLFAIVLSGFGVYLSIRQEINTLAKEIAVTQSKQDERWKQFIDYRTETNSKLDKLLVFKGGD